MFDAAKDIMNSFLGIAALIIPLLFIPELRKSKPYKIILGIAFIVLAWLGTDKIIRDKDEKSATERRRISDSTNMATLTSTIINMNKKDFDFKKDLKSKYNIIDSANKPTIYNTNIYNPRNVQVGPRR